MQGPNLGKGGIDTTPSDERAPPAPPAHLAGTDTADSMHIDSTAPTAPDAPVASQSQLLPRETGQDIGMGSRLPLSAEAVGIITRLRNMKVGMGSTFHYSQERFGTYCLLRKRTRTRTGPGGAMLFLRRRPGYTRRACPNKSCPLRIGANEAALRGLRLISLRRARLQMSNNLRRSRRPLRSRRKRPLQSSPPPRHPRKIRLCESRLPRTRRPRTGARNKPPRKLWCKSKTTARYTVASVICRCIRIRHPSGCTYSCMRCGTLQVWACLRRRCRRGRLRGGSGSEVLEHAVQSSTNQCVG